MMPKTDANFINNNALFGAQAGDQVYASVLIGFGIEQFCSIVGNGHPSVLQ